MPGVAQYLIALCAAAQEKGESFGIAVRIGASHSKLKIEATKVIHSILSFSPAPESVAVEFLNELAKVHGMSHLGECSLLIPIEFIDSSSEQSSQSCVVRFSPTPQPGLQRL
jgi:hypothetical protein